MAANNVPEIKMQEAEENSGKTVNAESKVSTGEDSCEAVTGLSVLPCATAINPGNNGELPRGDDVLTNGNMEVSQEGCVPQISADVSNGTSSRDKWRLQLRLVNGQFTPALKDALLRDLNLFLYSSPSSSFTPSFKGSGLRFGVVWFSPDNEHSYNWLVEKLTTINEKAGEFRFVIEPFAAYQNKICVNIPWDSKENLRDINVLKRLKFQNPSISADRWKIWKTKTTESNKLLFCTIDDASLNLLRKQNFRLNYGFNKVQADVLEQNKAAKSTKK